MNKQKIIGRLLLLEHINWEEAMELMGWEDSIDIDQEIQNIEDQLSEKIGKDILGDAKRRIKEEDEKKKSFEETIKDFLDEQARKRIAEKPNYWEEYDINNFPYIRPLTPWYPHPPFTPNDITNPAPWWDPIVYKTSPGINWSTKTGEAYYNDLCKSFCNNG